MLDGRWDVGFVRTGQVEQTLDPLTNEHIDPNLLKVLDPKIQIMTNGDLFPFLHSTPLFPEWPLAAKESVDLIVAEEVANAMIAMKYHGDIGKKMQECLDEARTDQEAAVCQSSPPVHFDSHARCDTTRGLAMLAYEAEIAGFHNGFRSPRSYFYVRTMQQEAGFVIQNEKNGMFILEPRTIVFSCLLVLTRFLVLIQQNGTANETLSSTTASSVQKATTKFLKSYSRLSANKLGLLVRKAVHVTAILVLKHTT